MKRIQKPFAYHILRHLGFSKAHALGACLKALVNENTLLPMQNVSEQNQKHFLCPGHKICVRNKCCAETFVSATMCPQQCVLVCQALLSQVLVTGLLCFVPASKVKTDEDMLM